MQYLYKEYIFESWYIAMIQEFKPMLRFEPLLAGPVTHHSNSCRW
jgi:hypothetical protein